MGARPEFSLNSLRFGPITEPVGHRTRVPWESGSGVRGDSVEPTTEGWPLSESVMSRLVA
jgi:hypothetical protein